MCYVCSIFIGSLRDIVSVLLFCLFSLHFYLYICYDLCNDAVSSSLDSGPYYRRQCSWVLSCNIFMNTFSLTIGILLLEIQTIYIPANGNVIVIDVLIAVLNTFHECMYEEDTGSGCQQKTDFFSSSSTTQEQEATLQLFSSLSPYPALLLSS
jgi:hypothetical protein